MDNKQVSSLKDSSLELSVHSKDQIEPQLPLLQQWVERAFFQFPYLWVPPSDKYHWLNVALIREKDALITLVRKDGEVVGVAAGVSLDSSFIQEEVLGRTVLDLFKERGYDPREMVYMCYFLTAPEHLNEPRLVEMIYNQFVDFAHKIGKSKLCYFEDPGKLDHPLRPEKLLPIEPWGHVIHGFTNMNVNVELSWPTLQTDGSVCDEAHAVQFFIKDLN